MALSDIVGSSKAMDRVHDSSSRDAGPAPTAPRGSDTDDTEMATFYRGLSQQGLNGSQQRRLDGAAEQNVQPVTCAIARRSVVRVNGLPTTRSTPAGRSPVASMMSPNPVTRTTG